MTRWDGPGLDAWSPWSPATVAGRLAAVAAPWSVVGGWALDLWRGCESRPHGDIEIAVPRRHFLEIRQALTDYVLFAVGSGEVVRLEPGGQMPESKHQCWVLDAAANCWRLDVMLEPGDARSWVFRRDERLRGARQELACRRLGARTSPASVD